MSAELRVRLLLLESYLNADWTSRTSLAADCLNRRERHHVVDNCFSVVGSGHSVAGIMTLADLEKFVTGPAMFKR